MAGPLPRARRAVLVASCGTVYWLATALLCFLTVNSLLFTSYFNMDYREIVFYRVDRIPLNLLWLALYAALFFLVFRLRLWERVSAATLEKVLLVYVAVVGTLWVFMVRGQPIFDSAFIVADAQAMAENDYYPLEVGAYSEQFPFQLGMVFYLEMLTRLFGVQNIYLVQMLNVGFAVLVYHFAVGITREVTGGPKAVFAGILLLFGCLQPLFYTSVIYGQLPGLALVLFAVRQTGRYCAGGKKWLLPGIALACAAACIFKSNYLIFSVAIALVLALHFVRSFSAASAAGAVAVAMCAIFAMQPIYWMYQARSGAEIGGIPKSAFLAMGLQEGPMAPGWYNDYQVEAYRRAGRDPAATGQAAKKEIAARVQVFAQKPAYAALFFYQKAISQWNEPSFEALWVNHYENQHERALSALGRSVFMGDAYRAILEHMNAYHLTVLVGAAVFLLMRRKKLTESQLLPALIFLGGFFFHLLWEGKSQYIWPYFVLLVPYCAGGVEELVARASRRR